MAREEYKNLTVRELIRELQKVPEQYQDLIIYATYDGNCHGGIYGVQFEPFVNERNGKSYMTLIGD